MNYLNYEPSTATVLTDQTKNKILKALRLLITIVATRNAKSHQDAQRLLFSTTKLVRTVIFMVEDHISRAVVLRITHVTSCLKVFTLTIYLPIPYEDDILYPNISKPNRKINIKF